MGQNWLKPDRYDIMPKMPEGSSQEQRPAMLQALLTERFKLELRFEAYNLTNSFMPSDPDVNVYSSTFGRVVGQSNIGRECQANLRLQF